MFDLADRAFMRQAIGLARPGTTFPNPAVGCVVIKDGLVVSTGATGAGGRPHAEEMALSLGPIFHGATAYITLEPCAKRSSPSLSCTQRLIEAKVSRVVFACDDPSPYAAKLGPLALQQAKIEVVRGCLAEEADYLIAPSMHYYATGLPLVVISTDGAECDERYRPQAGVDDLANLKDYARQGFRKLWVIEGSPEAHILQQKGLITL